METPARKWEVIREPRRFPKIVSSTETIVEKCRIRDAYLIAQAPAMFAILSKIVSEMQYYDRVKTEVLCQAEEILDKADPKRSV